MRRVPRSTALETSIKKESHRIPFVITFNPALPNIPQVISSNLNILHFSLRCLEETEVRKAPRTVGVNCNLLYI